MMWVWVMAFKIINILIPYLLIYNLGLIYFSSVADGAANLTLLADKRDVAGFINIGCGMVGGPQYYNDNGLYYTSDIGFINTGESMDVQKEYQLSHWSMYNAVRSFPDGSRNCYTLKPLQGKTSHYLIRAFFHYGNYDGLNRIPQFDLYIGVNYWWTVQPDDVTERFFDEIIYAPTEDLIYVCLVNTGSGTPFISGLELRPLNNSIYKSTTGALMHYESLTAGLLFTTDRDWYYSSIKDDPYDRQWAPFKKSWASWDSLSSNESMNSSFTDAYELPPSILKTAAIPEHGGGSLFFNWNNYSLTDSYQVYWHFNEIQKLGINDSREFKISMSGIFESGKISPEFGQPLTVISPVIQFNGSQLNFTITRTSKSTLPPILNALEIYKLVDLPASATYQNDVDAILNMKMNYTLPKDWQGDPCLPNAPWDGINCSQSVDHHSPRITSMNLAFSGLTGDIPHSLSALTSLVNLNLSHNSLTGVIPDFLAELPSLRTIDLTSNNLVGRVPKALSKKIEDGSLNLSLEGNPGLCSSNSCKKKNSKKIAIILVAISLIFIFVAIGVFYKYKQKKQGITARNLVSSSIQSESRAFSYSEVLKMTNNFQKVIGKGGSGIVYHGCLQDGTPVAVKMLTPTSKLSLKLFRTEAQLLTRVHHRNLVSLIGYYEEGTTMALIYEHVTNGNLHQHLSEKNGKVLSWKQRLQIAIDAAQGLEYLHNGCKPPIVHRDMKTSNILLDENLNAKISDFGISRTFSSENTEGGLSTDVVGTHGYVDPEYYSTRRPNKKSDVFSFGVVLLELITGKPSIIKCSAQPIHIIAWTVPKLESGDIHEIVDKKLEGHFTTNSAWKALEIAMMCVPSTAIQRPSMNQVLVDLNDCLAIEMSQGRTREIDNHGHGYPSIDTDHDNAIADTSIEMGPTAR